MAQVLMKEPTIVILDEPTGTMDLITKNEVANSILTARKETGSTFVIVSHDMEFVRKVCDRAVHMKLGKITSAGDVDSVLEEIDEERQDINAYLKRAKEYAVQDYFYEMHFYVLKAKEVAEKLNKDISKELEKFIPMYKKGIAEMLKEAERYATIGDAYGMDVYIDNAISYAESMGIAIDLEPFRKTYEKGLREALHEAEKHEAKGFLGMSYQYINRAKNYAEKLGKDIDEILQSLPWYKRWAMTNVYMKL